MADWFECLSIMIIHDKTSYFILLIRHQCFVQKCLKRYFRKGHLRCYTFFIMFCCYTSQKITRACRCGLCHQILKIFEIILVITNCMRIITHRNAHSFLISIYTNQLRRNTKTNATKIRLVQTLNYFRNIMFV